MFKKLVSVLAIAMLLVGVSPAAALGGRGASGNSVFDDFDSLPIKTPDQPGHLYWWVIQNGDGQQHYAHCADAACATAEGQRQTRFARLRIFHDQTFTTPEYNESEVAELRTGYAWGQPARWLPTAGHPVVLSARVRFSANYKPDGSGGAVGTAGLYLWNSPINYPGGTIHPPTALGFSWFEQGALPFPGLQAVAMQDQMPVYAQPIAADMTQWMVWTLVWSADRAGAQSVRYFVDGRPIGETQLASPLPALSIEIWNDNQFPAWTGITYRNPSSDQNVELDWIAAAQLDSPLSNQILNLDWIAAAK